MTSTRAGVPGGDMERTLYSGEYADFRISCNGAIFPVHKMVLGSASDFFRIMFESDFKETKDGVIDFPEDDPEAIGTIIHYLYTCKDFIVPEESFYEWMASVVSGPQVTTGATILSNAASQADSSTSYSSSRSKNKLRLILVYQAAEKFNIRVIQDRIFGFWKRNPSHFLPDGDDLVGFLDLLYSVTRADDDRLRLFATQECLADSSKLSSRPEIVAVMMKHEPVAWRIGTMYESKVEEQKKTESIRSVADLLQRNKIEKEKNQLSGENWTLRREKFALATKNTELSTKNDYLKARLKRLKGRNYLGKLSQRANGKTAEPQKAAKDGSSTGYTRSQKQGRGIQKRSK